VFTILGILILVVTTAAIVTNYFVCKSFYDYWKTSERVHWQVWGKPEFGDFYQNQLGLYRPIILGSEFDKFNNNILRNRRKNVRFTWGIVLAMLFSGCALVGFEADLRPAKSVIIPLENINL